MTLSSNKYGTEPADEGEGTAEDRLIARYFRPLATEPGAYALKDDAAVLVPPAGCDLVLKADAIIAGVHFLADDPPHLVAKKALRVNLSDLAAKGAKPLGFLLSLGLPAGVGDQWLAAFARGLKEDAQIFCCPLYGGDTVHSPERVMVSIAVFGAVPQGTMPRRGGARPGDRVVVTGTIGDAVLGLALLRDPAEALRLRLDEAAREHLIARYRLPQPRNVLAEIVRTNASASMDISDGLAGDLAKLCRVSGVDAVIAADRVPLSPAARTALAADLGWRERLLSGGDDYEILATVAPERVPAMIAAAEAVGVTMTAIGHIAAGAGQATFFTPDSQPLRFARASFSHFD